MSLRQVAAIVLPIFVSGCGSYVPALQNFYEKPDDARIKVETLVANLECEVRTSVQAVLLDDMDLAPVRRAHGLKAEVLGWLKNWAAQITLTLTVEEKTTFNPGVAFNTIYPNAISTFTHSSSVTTPQSFSLGLAGAFSTDATRKETLSLYMDFSKFTDVPHLNAARAARQEGSQQPCNQVNGVFIESDIKFKDWLYTATLPAVVQGGAIQDYAKSLQAEEKNSKKDVISHEVTFVVIYGANVTPTWKFVNISGNQGSSPFVGAQRTNTQDVIITLGPAQGDTLSTAAQNTILASQIGIAVGNAIKNSQ